MEEAGMKTIETNNIPLNRIGDGFSGLGGYTSCTSLHKYLEGCKQNS